MMYNMVFPNQRTSLTLSWTSRSPLCMNTGNFSTNIAPTSSTASVVPYIKKLYFYTSQVRKINNFFKFDLIFKFLKIFKFFVFTVVITIVVTFNLVSYHEMSLLLTVLTSASALTKILAYNFTILCTKTAWMWPGRSVIWGWRRASRTGWALGRYLKKTATMEGFNISVHGKIDLQLIIVQYLLREFSHYPCSCIQHFTSTTIFSSSNKQVSIFYYSCLRNRTLDYSMYCILTYTVRVYCHYTTVKCWTTNIIISNVLAVILTFVL